MTTQLLEDLRWRGLVQDCTDMARLDAVLGGTKVSVYCGFDPTAKSLHVGNLIPLLGLARFQQAGHRPLALIGGATGLIGDPSGKSAERNLQTLREIADRSQAICEQLGRFLDFTNLANGKIVNNLEWTQGQDVLGFLRDIGKHFSVSAMISRDSIRSRLDRSGEGISFTEFSYMLLQAQDFLRLFESENCTLQIGGSDQWGNMCSGADLIRRKHGAETQALTFPLLTTSEGEKFGKTAKGAVWLDSALTSVWDFFQFWLNTSDADVVRFLKLFTFISRPEIESLEQNTAERPHLREAQKRLALEVTALVHGEAAAADCLQTAEVLFGGSNPANLSETALAALAEALPTLELATVPSGTLAQVLVKLGLEPSMARANESIKAGAVWVTGEKVLDPKTVLEFGSPLQGRWSLIRKGKKSFAVVRHN